jgi:hypothetical protein
MAVINKFAPERSYSPEEIAAQPEEPPRDAWSKEQLMEYDHYAWLLKIEKPSRFQLGLPSEADCLAIIKALLDADSSPSAIGPNCKGITPLELAKDHPNIVKLLTLSRLKAGDSCFIGSPTGGPSTSIYKRSLQDGQSGRPYI